MGYNSNNISISNKKVRMANFQADTLYTINQIVIKNANELYIIGIFNSSFASLPTKLQITLAWSEYSCQIHSVRPHWLGKNSKRYFTKVALTIVSVSEWLINWVSMATLIKFVT